jgi:hypothetical protein
VPDFLLNSRLFDADYNLVMRKRVCAIEDLKY